MDIYFLQFSSLPLTFFMKHCQTSQVEEANMLTWNNTKVSVVHILNQKIRKAEHQFFDPLRSLNSEYKNNCWRVCDIYNLCPFVYWNYKHRNESVTVNQWRLCKWDWINKELKISCFNSMEMFLFTVNGSNVENKSRRQIWLCLLHFGAPFFGAPLLFLELWNIKTRLVEEILIWCVMKQKNLKCICFYFPMKRRQSKNKRMNCTLYRGIWNNYKSWEVENIRLNGPFNE